MVWDKLMLIFTMVSNVNPYTYSGFRHPLAYNDLGVGTTLVSGIAISFKLIKFQ